MGYKIKTKTNINSLVLKLLCLIISTLLLLSHFTFVFNAGDENITKIKAVCDMNGDGRIAAADARLLLRAASRIGDVFPTSLAKSLKVKLFGDLNADDKISAADARILLRVSANIQDLSNVLPLLFESGEPIKPDEPDIPLDIEKLLTKNELLTPFQDHGLGKAKMCKILLDYVEAMPSGVNHSKSHPKFSPMLKNTYDYYISDEYHDGIQHYVLKSGRKVTAVKHNIRYSKLLENTYKMPTNTVANMASSSSSHSTDLYIKTKWLVPINVTFEPQKYYVGYESREWNLSQFEAEYMDIVFYYTNIGAGSLSFKSNSVISKGEWISSDNDKTTLRLYFSEKGGFYGYNIKLLESGYLHITLKHKSDSLTGKTVMIDPGHGAEDPGTKGIDANGVTYEKAINLSVSMELKRILEERGANVVMTREDDSKNPSLIERSAMTRKHNPDVFVSVHSNASSSSSAHGTEVYYFYPYAMPFAKILQNKLVNAYKTKIYTNKPEMKNIDRGHKFWPYAVARIESCPSVLVELGFMSNATEFAALKNESNQKALALALADGITDFLGAPKPKAEIPIDDKQTNEKPAETSTTQASAVG